MNDNGASLLLNGKYEAAIEAFKQAVSHLRRLSELTAPSLSSLGVYGLPLPYVNTCYNRVIVFALDTTRASFFSQDFASLNAIVSFNIGLSYHCWGMEKNKSRHLLEACLFYEISQAIVNEVAIFSDFSQQLMVVAIYNQSHIFFEVQEFQKHQEAMEMLQIIVDALHPCGSICNILEDEDFTAISLYTALCAQPCAAASA